ncbi:MAG TPA: S-layer homology domain-containing protein, partial [Candidatus Gracilibacteria bacterium]
MDFVAYLRKSLASLTLTAMVATFVVAPIAQAGVEDFTDVAEIPAWADEAIEELMDMGVIAGNDDGSFAPNRQLNRAEVSKIIVLATGIDFDTSGGPHFPDVPENAWFYDYIETMYNYGWVNGYPDGYFRPGVGINRAEIAKMVINAFEIDQDLSGAPHFDDASESDWFYGYVETAYNYGLMRGYGDGTFGPANAVTRAEAVKVVYDSLLVVSVPSGPAEGTLEVSLSADTPRGTNIPFNATSVPFTTVELTASDDSDVEISSLTFTRLGLGDNDDFDNVWLEVDGFKIGNDKSVNNDDIAELRFNPPLIVPAGQTVVADLVGSMETSAAVAGGRHNTGHHNRFAVISGDDLVSTAANVVGDFPIEGEEMEIADYEVSQIRFSSLGSDSTVDVGDNFIEIGKFRLLNDSNTNKDVELRAVTFKNDGTAELEDSLENISLYVSGEQVSAETIVDGDYLTFRLDNGVTGGYIIEDGDSRIFSIRADIVSAEKDDTINLKVDNFEDIVGVEVGTSFGVKAVAGDNGFSLSGSGQSASTTSASCTTGVSAAEDDCARLKAYVIDSGDLNVSRDPSSIGNQEYAPGSNDVVFLTARVVVDQPMIVDGLTIHVETGSTVSDKTDTNTTA